MDALHPLESLPVVAVAEWAAQVEAPLSLRERVGAYLTKKGGKLEIFRFRLASLTRSKAPLTRDELLVCHLSVNELFGDTGVATSLVELIKEGIVTELGDLTLFGVGAADILGPFSSAARHARLSMTALHNAFPRDTAQFAKDMFELNPLIIVEKYGKYLHPSDFNALALRFDGMMMRKESLVLVMRKHLRELRVLCAFPYREWNMEAGLDDDYLALLFGTKDKKKIAVMRDKIWKL